MRRTFSAVILASALFGTAPSFAQTTTTAAPGDVISQVLGLAPQLVAFAGSDANFRSLVAGLSQGAPVTLVSTTPDGLTQTVTFTPAGTMSATDVARTLETARQQLISRGVGAPTAVQIGTTLVGGTLATPAGTAQVPSTVATVTPAGVRGNASTGATIPRLGAANPTSNLTVETQATNTNGATTGAGGTSTNTGATGTSTTSSGTGTSGTSAGTGNTGTPASPGLVFSGPSPIFTTTPSASTGTTNPNGAPSPAVQMQGHR
jgi:hypothetical protein